MWREGLNYLHGTGHGVGTYLNVHEGPHQFRLEWKPAPLVAGMTITDEPGIYLPDRCGARTENTLLIVPYKETEFGKFLQFESLTLCPNRPRDDDPRGNPMAQRLPSARLRYPLPPSLCRRIRLAPRSLCPTNINCYDDSPRNALQGRKNGYGYSCNHVTVSLFVVMKLLYKTESCPKDVEFAVM